MEEKLKCAAEAGDFDAFYGVLQTEPEILKTIDGKDFVETPLHTAALAGQTHLALEILSLKPSFGTKLNSTGYSPLDLALRNRHRETVKRFVTFEHDLVRVRSRERKTPLHYVAEIDDVNLLAEFLIACPLAIKELTVRGETAVHVAVLKGNFGAFVVPIGWLKRTENKDILGWKDENGNTVLHIAAKTSQVQVVKVLIKEKVGLDEKNHDSQTALDIVSSRTTASQEDREIQKMLRKASALETSELSNVVPMEHLLASDKHALCRAMARFHVFLDKGITDDSRNMFLVVTVLVVTATFQAVLSPPGGGWRSTDESDYNNSSSIDRKFSKDFLFEPFAVANSLAFSASLALTLMLLPFRRSVNLLLAIPLCCLMGGYMISVFLISPPTHWKPGIIASAVIVEVLFLGAFLTVIFPVDSRTALSLPPSLSRWPRRMLSKRPCWYQMEKQVRLGKYVTFDSQNLKTAT